jgi:ribonuclease J
LALFSDSTNATEPGHTVSEKVVEAELDRIIEKAKGRVIVATFSSLIGRVDQVIQSALKHNRKIFLSGRSMEDNVEIASNLGYIKTPRGSIRKLDQLRGVPDRQAMIVTTGSQGEEMSALTRISLGTHSKIKIKPGDTIILSSSPIIGNEKAVVTVINNLIQLGAHVVTNRNLDVHTSGHGKQGDLKLMLSLVRPRFLVPIHGELHMRAAHRDLAEELGLQEKNIALINNGEILEFFDGKMRKSKSKFTVNNIMIDGHGVGGDDASLVQKERQIMSESGMVIVMLKIIETGKLIADPVVISKGFLYSKEGKDIFGEVIRRVITEETSETITAMLVNSVESGVAKAAKISGYLIGGKTGTAQIAKNGRYETGVGSTIGSFVGFAPANDPQFVILVKMDRRRSTEWGSASSIPLFKRITEFMLDYYAIMPKDSGVDWQLRNSN